MCKILVSQKKQNVIVAATGSAAIFTQSLTQSIIWAEASTVCAVFVFLYRNLGFTVNLEK
jgi:hypothetical protein